MTDAAPSSRATRHATRAVAPVATPSSTTIAVRPARSIGGASPRKRATRASSSARSRRSTFSSAAGETPPNRSTSSLSTRAPRSPMAPIATSGCCGSPSFRTTSTSSGASSDGRALRRRARRRAEGRARRVARTRRPANACARRRPASRRSVKWSMSSCSVSALRTSGRSADRQPPCARLDDRPNVEEAPRTEPHGAVRRRAVRTEPHSEEHPARRLRGRRPGRGSGSDDWGSSDPQFLHTRAKFASPDSSPTLGKSLPLNGGPVQHRDSTRPRCRRAWSVRGASQNQGPGEDAGAHAHSFHRRRTRRRRHRRLRRLPLGRRLSEPALRHGGFRMRR